MIFTFLLISAVIFGVIYELRTSTLQSHYLSGLAAKIGVRVLPGKSPSIQFPKAGPYDMRFGYVELPTFLRNLETAGYDIEAQARFSPFLLEYTRAGFYPAYREKSQAGLRIEDRLGRLIYASAYPERIFSDCTQIPPWNGNVSPPRRWSWGSKRWTAVEMFRGEAPWQPRSKNTAIRPEV